MVFVDGIYQIPNIDYTISGNLVTFSEAPEANSNLVVQSFNNTLGTNAIVADPGNITVANVDTVIDTFNATDFRTAKYVISVSASSEYQATEAMLVHDGANVKIVTYAVLYTGSAAIMTFTANIVGNSVRLYGNTVTGSSTVKLQKTYVKV